MTGLPFSFGKLLVLGSAVLLVTLPVSSGLQASVPLLRRGSTLDPISARSKQNIAVSSFALQETQHTEFDAYLLLIQG